MKRRTKIAIGVAALVIASASTIVYIERANLFPESSPVETEERAGDSPLLNTLGTGYYVTESQLTTETLVSDADKDDNKENSKEDVSASGKQDNSGNNSGADSDNNSASGNGSNNGNSHNSTTSTTPSGNGTNVASNSGSNTGNNSGANTGSNTGSNSGSNAGSNAGSNNGSNSGAGNGSNSGNNSGSNNSSANSSNNGSNSGSNAGKTWHPPVYEEVWVVDREAWTEEVPVYETRYREVCNQCGAYMYSSDDISNHYDYGNTVCGAYHSEYYQIQVGTQTIKHEAEGHREEKVVKEGYWE